MILGYGDDMKKLRIVSKLLFTTGLVLVLAGVIFLRSDNIQTLFNTYFSSNSNKVIIDGVNDYYRDYDFMFVQNVNNIKPSDKKDLINIYYSVINSGKDNFTFYCPLNDYSECLNDVQDIANDQTLLSNINNYTHPYNAFKHIETEYDNLGKVKISITRGYTKSQINKINKEVNKLYKELVNEDKPIVDNIKNIHDYIINNSKYDELRSDKNVLKYHSDIAYGPLFEGYAVCGGYTDLMQLFLEKMNIKSFRVSSNDHIWNALLVDNEWYHIDLTWDDPVTEDGKDYLSHEFLLIKTDKLISSSHEQHIFDENVFEELKRN